jgi:hypothetical protein
VRAIPFGWYAAAGDKKPAHDPGVEGIDCPRCNKPLTTNDLRTISLRELSGGHSLFYRLHRTCAEAMTHDETLVMDDFVLFLGRETLRILALPEPERNRAIIALGVAVEPQA